ncbi:MAG: HEAT repeat domain-containing protein [Myxococcota bacterium]
MQPGKATAHDVAPLVFELTRAVRARRANEARHASVAEALRRCEAARQRLPVHARELVLEANDTGLFLQSGVRLTGPGADELAADLHARQLARFELGEKSPLDELSRLVESLAREPGASAHEGSPPSNAERNALLTRHIADLVRSLSELELRDDLAGYNLTANRIEVSVDVLLRAKRGIDAYRAALVLARHATDRDLRSDAIRREAGERLARLAHREELLNAVIDQACGPSGLATVQASQVLIAIGALAVPRLLLRLSDRTEGVRARVTQVLIALGDAALAQVVDELASQQPDRARRAARLLGDMQNPKAVSFLADALSAPDLALAREAAQALVRIGDDAAAQALIAGLARRDEVAEACAACLGGLKHPASLPALAALADERSKRSENVRRAAIASLGRIGSPAAFARLKKILDHAPFFGAAKLRSLRVAAAQAIGQIGGDSAAEVLAAHARRGDPTVRQACQDAARRLAAGSKRKT